MSQSIIPFTPEEMIEDFGELAATLTDIDKIKTQYPVIYDNAVGITPQEKQLSLICGCIEGMAVTIDDNKLKIGFLIFIGNIRRLYDHAGANIASMEDYLKNVRHISPALIEESKRMYNICVELRQYGIDKASVQQATPTQIGAISNHIRDVKKQQKERLDEQARNAGAKDFRSLPPQKKEEIAQEVKSECENAICSGVNFILNSPAGGEAHQAVAKGGGKSDRPLIIINVSQADVVSRNPPAVQLLFSGGRCELNEQQIYAMKRGHFNLRFITKDDEGQETSFDVENLGRWAEDVL
jgi:hypothetical protein